MLGLTAAPQVDAADSTDETKLSAREEKFRDEHVKVLQKGSSSKASKQAALEQLPLAKLSGEQRQRVHDVLESISLFRELPTVSYQVEPEVFHYFLNHPDMAVGIWRAMGISKFSLSQTAANEFQADCGDGTSGVIEVMHRGADHVLLYCDGGFKNALMLKPVRSQCVLFLQWSFTKNSDDRPFVKQKATMFVSFPSNTVETAARVVSPVSNHIVDHNVREISLFVHMMSQAMQKQPGWVERTTNKVDGVLDVRKQQLLKLSAQVYLANRKRELRKMGDDEITIDEVLTPLREAQKSAEQGSSRR